MPRSEDFRKIGPKWAMFLEAGPAIVGAMIEIWLDHGQPPTGRVAAPDGAPAQPFVGWLQLLAILAEVFQRDTRAGPAALKPAAGPSPADPAET